MSDELEVLKNVTSTLEKAHIDYMLTGSLAANYYAIPRMTRDIDLVIELKEGQVPLLVSHFKDDYYADEEMAKEAVKRKGQFNLIHNQTAVKVDLIIRKNNSYRETEFSRKKRTPIDGFHVWIVSAEDLVLSKLFWAKDNFSEKQIDDVKNILKSQNSLDMEYIKKWTEDLGLEEVYEKTKS